MREKNLDWKIYHIIAARPSIAYSELVSLVESESEMIDASLVRLVEKFLIVIQEEKIRAASIQETLIGCQAKHYADSPIYIENGVIKVKTRFRGEK